jgi:hypothetical protein
MATLMDEWRVLPRLAFLAMIVMAFRVVEWYMTLPAAEATVERSGFVSVVVGALTGAFAVWIGKEK